MEQQAQEALKVVNTVFNTYQIGGTREQAAALVNTMNAAEQVLLDALERGYAAEQRVLAFENWIEQNTITNEERAALELVETDG